MKIDIADLLSIEDMTKECQVHTDLTFFESKLGKFPVIEKAPFKLHFENQQNEKLLIRGETDVTLELPCDRCLKEIPVVVHLTIDRIYPLEESESEEEEYSEDTGYLTGTVLDVDSLVYHEILINRPMKVLCSESCKGICRKCGANLNDTDCSCDRIELDPRMAAIQDVFHQFKEV